MQPRGPVEGTDGTDYSVPGLLMLTGGNRWAPIWKSTSRAFTVPSANPSSTFKNEVQRTYKISAVQLQRLQNRLIIVDNPLWCLLMKGGRRIPDLKVNVPRFHGPPQMRERVLLIHPHKHVSRCDARLDVDGNLEQVVQIRTVDFVREDSDVPCVRPGN